MLYGTDPDDAAAAVEAALRGIEPDPAGVAYELWRMRIRNAPSKESAA